jgi:hypothetical protein
LLGVVILTWGLDMACTNPLATEESGNDVSVCRRAVKYRDMSLLIAASESGAHIAPHGNAAKLFKTAATACRTSVAFTTAPNITAKSIWDRFQKLLADHREREKANKAASGICEEYGPKVILLQEMMESVDDFIESEKQKTSKTKTAGLRLIEAGIEMRDRHLGRQRGRKRKNDPDEISEDKSAERAPRDPLHSDGISSSELELIEKSESRQIEQLELDRSRVNLQETMLQMIRTKMDHLERTFSLDKSRVDFHRKRSEAEQQQIELAAKRVKIDENRLEFDREKFKADTMERMQTLEPIAKLTQKLSELFNCLHKSMQK